MSIVTIAFTNNGIIVADGAAAAAQIVQSATSANYAAVVIRTADNAAPAVEYVKNISDIQQIGANLAAGNTNAIVKEAFASTLGMMAAAISLPVVGPAGALAADALMSEAFKTAYDAASTWSTRRDWSPLFDLFNDPGVSHPITWTSSQEAIDRGLIDPKTLLPRIPQGTNNLWNQARIPTPRDPLAIDLDGDGIETTPVLAGGVPTLFDHDADGVRTGTGWLRPDDGWLVLDRNGNGTIDSGRELFGVDTLINVTETDHRGTLQTVTRNASSGFEALRTLDVGNGSAGSAGNGDNVFNASDAAFTQVRVWRDLNGDGTSQAGELQTLAQAGIASIALNATSTNINLGNGNTVTGTATVTRTNGGTTLAETVSVQAGNLDLTNNPFYREFTNTIPLTDAARALPEMGGSGVLRDLREAMSLGTPQANSLVSLVQGFAAAGTRTQQLQRMHALLEAWASTSAKYQPMTEFKYLSETTVREDATSVTTRFLGNGVDRPGLPDKYVAMWFDSNDYLMWQSGSAGAYQTPNAAGMEVLRKIGVLEAFNGAPFVDFTMTRTKSTGGGGSGGGGGTGGGGSASADQYLGLATLRADQVASVNQAYDALVDSVYAALALQTRLRPYLDAIELVIDAGGVRFETTELNTRVTAQYASEPQKGLEDLAELLLFAAPTLAAVGYNGVQTLRSWVEALPANSPLWNALAVARVRYGDALGATLRGDVLLGGTGNNTINALDGDDLVDGGVGDDELYGGSGNDILIGGDGNDQLYADGYHGGAGGDDTLDGGAGNDKLKGGEGSETYLFGRGDGQDHLYNNAGDGPDPTAATSTDTLQFKAGIAAGDINLLRSDDRLVIKIKGSTDQVMIQDFFVNDGLSDRGYALDQIRFADGATWSLAQIKALMLQGSVGNDVIYGYATNDTISGADGNDDLYGRDGNDTLLGGVGNDVLHGGAGNDILDGGAGNDILAQGRRGYWNGNYNDAGDDIYKFGRGDGQDSIVDEDDTAGNLDQIVFKAGVAEADVQVVRDDSETLILKINGTTDQVSIPGYFSDNGVNSRQIEEIRFADSPAAVWKPADIKAKLLIGTAGNDVITGYASGDTISGDGGNDSLYGRDGNDVINGGDGDDQLSGESDSDTLFGGMGNDVLLGGAGNDTLVGGAGDDLIKDFSGHNTYLFGPGDGRDLIISGSYNSGGRTTGTIQISSGVAPSNVQLTRVTVGSSRSALQLAIAGSTDKITIENFYYGDDPWNSQNGVQYVNFADGTLWDIPIITRKMLEGTSGSDQLIGTIANDTISGAAGDDMISGGAGDDVIDGGAGNDTLVGGLGDNIYRFELGGGNDRIGYAQGWGVESGTLSFGVGIRPSDVYLREIPSTTNYIGSKDLKFGIIGSTDSVVVTGFGDTRTNPINKVQFADGTIWDIPALQSYLAVPNRSPQLVAPLSDIVLNEEQSFSFEVPLGTFSDPDIGDGIVLAASAVGLGGSLPGWLHFDSASRTFSGTAPIGAPLVAVIDVRAMDTAGLSTSDVFLLSVVAQDRIVNGTAADDLVVGFSGNDTLFGLGGNDVLLGKAGNDRLDGGEGADSITGGLGNDIYIVNSTSDVVTENANEGTDTIESSVTIVRLAANVENLTLTGTTNLNGTGNTLDNILIGNNGVNSLNGGDGNDTLDGLAGGDTLFGGLGNDTFVVDSASDVVTENIGAGTDTVMSSVTLAALAANIENLVLTGINAINGAGNSLANRLTGNGANNTLDGMGGADTMIGGLGDDIYIVDNNSDILVEDPGEGIDTIRASVTVTSLAGNVENLTLTGTTNINGTGNGLDNKLTGNSGANSLTGGDGNDTLDGLAGNDRLIGGLGNDTFVVDSALDVVTEDAGAGTDTVMSSVSLTTLAANVENLMLIGSSAINGAGNTLVNRLTGNSADNALDGKAGADIMVGGLGNDSYTVDDSADTAVELAGQGNDSVISSVTFALPANIENMTLAGLTAINATGNALNNVLTGNGVNNTLDGGDGNDTINGGAGIDIMIGGVGDDTYYVDSTADVVSEGAGGGTDTVISAVSLTTLANNVENLTLTGSGILNGTGNTLNNVLTGNGAANILSGGDGNDTLKGGAGNDRLVGGFGDDTYLVDSTGDVVTELSGAGTDTVVTSVTLTTLANDVENLTLTGTAALNGTGNTLNNILVGNSSANTLSGGIGNDTLNGAGGNDRLIGGTGSDSYVFGRGWGVDSVQENDSAVGVKDVVLLQGDLNQTNLLFVKAGNNLEMSIIGLTDKLVFQNWYLGGQYRVEEFKFTNGSVLTDTQAQALVGAMASFSASVAGSSITASRSTIPEVLLAPALMS